MKTYACCLLLVLFLLSCTLISTKEFPNGITFTNFNPTMIGTTWKYFDSSFTQVSHNQIYSKQEALIRTYTLQKIEDLGDSLDFIFSLRDSGIITLDTMINNQLINKVSPIDTIYRCNYSIQKFSNDKNKLMQSFFLLNAQKFNTTDAEIVDTTSPPSLPSTNTMKIYCCPIQYNNEQRFSIFYTSRSFSGHSSSHNFTQWIEGIGCIKEYGGYNSYNTHFNRYNRILKSFNGNAFNHDLILKGNSELQYYDQKNKSKSHVVGF